MNHLYRMIILIALIFSFAIKGNDYLGTALPSPDLSIAHIIVQGAERFCINVFSSGRTGLNFCTKYPRVMILSIVSIVLAIPPVRRWFYRHTKNGIDTIFWAIINGVKRAIKRFLFDEVHQLLRDTQDNVHRHDAVLNLHTQKLGRIQGGVAKLQKNVRLLHTDVAAVQKRLEDAHMTLASIQTDVQGQAQELHGVRVRCDEIKVSLDGYGQQLTSIESVLNRLDSSFDERVGRQVAGLAAELASYEKVLATMNRNVRVTQKLINRQLTQIVQRMDGLSETQRSHYNSLQSSFDTHATSIGKRFDQIEESGKQRHEEMLAALQQGLSATVQKKPQKNDWRSRPPFVSHKASRVVDPVGAT